MRDLTALEARRVLDGDGHSGGEDESTMTSASKYALGVHLGMTTLHLAQKQGPQVHYEPSMLVAEIFASVLNRDTS